MAAAAAMLKRTARLASRSLLTSSSRSYVPVEPTANFAPNLSFSTNHLGDIFKRNFGTGIDRWAASKENSVATVGSFCRGTTLCTPQFASLEPVFSRRFMSSTTSNSLEAVPYDVSKLPANAPPRLKFKRLDKTARHIMQILDKEAVEQVKDQREIPEIKPGYIIQLKLEVPENKRRVSIIKGIVIARRNAGVNTTIRLRRLVAGVGVESLLPLYSPNIKEITVLEKKKVRRAKLYYLRDKMNALKKH